MENLFTWIKSSPEAKKISNQAKEKAWRNFKSKFPNAVLSKFVARVDFTDKTHATADIHFKAGPGFWQSVSLSNPKD